VGAQSDQALTRLFEREYPAMLGTARLLLDDREHAEDVVQEAFIKVGASWRRIREPDRAAGYLRATVVNLARGRNRRRLVALRHAEVTLPAFVAVEDAVVEGDERRRVAATLRTLPDRQRECLVLRYWLELSDAEIGRALGISAGSVKTHLHRARAAVAEKLEAMA
jgi:RNA polymerase sigma-70 factor (sigma-E family)